MLYLDYMKNIKDFLFRMSKKTIDRLRVPVTKNNELWEIDLA